MKMSSEKRALDKIYKRRDRYEIPDWQRQGVWETSQRQKLIDTILRGWKLPKFYFLRASSEAEVHEVVDGQQRLTAILDFFENTLPLSEESAKIFGGKFYKDLSPKFSDFFDDFEIEYDVLTDATDEEIKEFFQRLQAGLPLSSSEKLNAIHSNLRDFVKELSVHPFFKSKVAVSDKRYGHFDIISKVAALEVEGLDCGLRFEDLRDLFESHASFSDSSAVAKRLKRTLDHLNVVFPAKTDLLRNRTVVQSFCTFAAKLDADNLEGKQKLLGSFFESFSKALGEQVELGAKSTDPDFVEFQRTVSANLRSGAQKRQVILIRKFLQFSSDARQLLDPTTVVAAGIPAEIGKKAERVADLIQEVNAIWQAKTGKDLFKPTNKTVSAIRNFGKQLSNVSSYEQLVDSLYFVFWEGPGERLGDGVPLVFKDINGMRTGIRHDVDHGKSKKVAQKNKAISAAFKKYGGADTPELLGNEQFPVFQLALLDEIERALVGLKSTDPASFAVPAAAADGH